MRTHRECRDGTSAALCAVRMYDERLGMQVSPSLYPERRCRGVLTGVGDTSHSHGEYGEAVRVFDSWVLGWWVVLHTASFLSWIMDGLVRTGIFLLRGWLLGTEYLGGIDN